jgi:hypothetical protein
MKNDDSELYLVNRRIIYHNPNHELSETVVEPGQVPEGLPFPHLSKADRKLLCKKRILQPILTEK